MFRNPSSAEIRELLTHAKTIAVVGLSPNPERPSHRIARRLQEWGYRIVPVRPAVERVLGEKTYPRLLDIPERVDLVDVFRAAPHLDPIVRDCIERRMPALWLQTGIVNEVAAARAAAAGIRVVMDRCIAIDYRHLVLQPV